jgi:hypothetical protein
MLFEYVRMLCKAAIKGHCSLPVCLIWTYHISLSETRIHEFSLKMSLLWRDTVSLRDDISKDRRAVATQQSAYQGTHCHEPEDMNVGHTDHAVQLARLPKEPLESGAVFDVRPSFP